MPTTRRTANPSVATAPRPRAPRHGIAGRRVRAGAWAGAAAWLAPVTAAAGSVAVAQDGVAADPVRAAFHACAGQPVSVEERLATLSATGWFIAPDPPAEGDLFAPGFATRPGYWVPGEGRAREAAVAGQGARPLVSRAYPDPEDEAFAIVPGGGVVDAAAVVAFIGPKHGGGTFYYVAPESVAALKLMLMPHSGGPSSYFVVCDLYLAAALADEDLAAMLPGDLRPGDLRRGRPENGAEGQRITYSTTAGYMGEITYLDAPALPTYQAYRSRFPTTAPLAAVVSFESRNLTLSD